MDLIGLLRDLLFDYTLRTVALGAATLGIVSGMLGSYAVLRKQSLLGDAMSHAALPGIALAFLLTGSKAPFVLLLGAALAGWVGTLLVMSIVKTTRIKNDSALGLILSVFFGFGLMLLTYIQRLPNATQAGLDKFLFGQAATLLVSDVIIMAGLGTLALSIMMVFWKEFKLLSFDPDFGATLGLPIRVLDVLLTTLLVVAIVLGLQTVGVVLMSAMVVAPAAAARQWTNRLGVMIGLAGLFGGLAGASGAVISSSAAHLPTGPTIVLCVSTIVVASLLLAPNRGLLWQWARRRRNRRRLRVEAVLSDLYALASQHERMDHGHSIAVLRAMSAGRGGVRRSLEELAARGWAQPATGDAWILTSQGRAEAERMVGQREA
ncbi:MAG: metal ABC transporter permease [Chloroflexota bacterium]|nr:metal ABC transporter permease [Chloroflexota bacterium]